MDICFIASVMPSVLTLKKWGPWEVAKTQEETTTNAIENGAQRLSS